MASRTCSLLLFFALLVGCNQATQSNLSGDQPDGGPPSTAPANISEAASAPPRTSDPTGREAQRALSKILEASGLGFVLYNPVGQPRGCVDGRDASGRIVRTCDICASVLTSDRGSLQIERSEFSVPFRRAISPQQPEIAPLDGGGVWVAAVPDATMGSVSVARSRSYVSRRLTNDDLEPLRMRIQTGMAYRGTVCLPPEDGQALGLCVLSGSQSVMNALSTPQAKRKMQEIAGSCDESAPGSLDSATLPKLTSSMSYSQVRRALIESEWKPVDLARGRSCGWDRCPPFPEVLQCRANADAECSYAWRRGPEWLMVFAAGEDSTAEGQGFVSTRRCQTIAVEHTGPEKQWVEYNCT